MGGCGSHPGSQQLASELCSVGKELSQEESLMILRFWREIAAARRVKEKQLEKHTSKKPKHRTLGLTAKKGKGKTSALLSSEISRAEFLDLFKQISGTEQFSTHYPILKKQNAIEYLFQAFDSTNRGQISLEEFITGLSVLSSGTFRQKAEMIFHSCDLNNDGELTKDELAKSLRKGIRGAINVLKKEAPDISPEDLMKITARMNELSVQRTVDHIFEVCGAEEHIALSDWLDHHESDDALRHLLCAMTVSDPDDETVDTTSFSHVFPIHPKLLE